MEGDGFAYAAKNWACVEFYPRGMPPCPPMQAVLKRTSNARATKTKISERVMLLSLETLGGGTTSLTPRTNAACFNNTSSTHFKGTAHVDVRVFFLSWAISVFYKESEGKFFFGVWTKRFYCFFFFFVFRRLPTILGLLSMFPMIVWEQFRVERHHKLTFATASAACRITLRLRPPRFRPVSSQNKSDSGSAKLLCENLPKISGKVLASRTFNSRICVSAQTLI